MVPLNEQDLMLDLMRHLGLPVVVAARTSLGTINHTLLTLAALRGAQLNVRGVVLIGAENIENRRAIEHLRECARHRTHPCARKNPPRGVA